ncbi:MAG: glycerophosphodiester phosphodiesterase [Oscillospiraceae bacterium]|nr:glycerophosphodiester phosphodiesterase [Oscillospiraceae bacterium]
MNPLLYFAVILVSFSVLLAIIAAVLRRIKIMIFKANTPAVPEKFTVTAHTGCLGTAPNTVDSMKKGAAAGADIIEFDVNFDKNGEPVLSHDDPDAGAVHLKEAFKFLSEHKNIRANVDVKNTSHLEKVSKYAEEYGVLKQIFFTGVFAEDVSAVERLCPQIPYYLNYSVNSNGSRDIAYISHIVEIAEKCGAVGINVHYKSASKELVEAFHNKGLSVSLWTVNSERSLVRTLRLGPDNITTKRPDRLCNLLEKSSC